MKKTIAIVLGFVIILTLAACGGTKGNKIPDVFGINYTDAIAVLEAEGFEVRAIGTDVESIAQKLLYPLKKVDEGAVFKIDDYIIDNNGNLNKNYDVFYDGELISEDKSVVIYYAQEAYTKAEEVKQTEATTIPVEDDMTAGTTTETEETEPETTQTEAAEVENGIDPDFKEAMDSYEAFMDEYVAFMKKYKNNPSDLSLLADYASYMGKYAEFAEGFEKWETEDMNADEYAYYFDVQSRVSKKLLEVAQ